MMVVVEFRRFKKIGQLMQTAADYSRGYTYREMVSRSIAWGHHFLFFNVLFAVFTGFAYVYAAPSAGSFVSFMYLLVTWLGHMTFLAFTIYVVVFFPISFIGNYRWYRIISVVTAVILFWVLLFDIKLYLAVKVHLSLMSLSLIFTTLNFSTGLNYNFLFIAVPIVIVCELIFAKLASRNLYSMHDSKSGKVLRVVILGGLGVCFVISHIMHIWADAYQYEKITVLRQAFPAHYPMTAKSFLESHGYLDPKTPRAEQIFNIVYPLEPVVMQGQSEGYNIITISLNGVSYSTLNERDNPELLRLKMSAHSFEQHYLPYDNVADNYYTLAYGLPTLYRASLGSLNTAPVIVDALYRREYTIRSLESASDSRPPTGITGVRELEIANEASSVSVLSAAILQVESWEQNHSYALMLSLNDLLDSKDEASYLHNLRMVDDSIGRLIRTLRTKGYLDNTMILITSSQGSAFVGDGSRYYDRIRQHVPLFIIWPNQNNIAVSSQELSSHFDIAATIGTEILGIGINPAMYTLGADLKNVPKRDFVISDNDGDIVLIKDKYCAIYTKDAEILTEILGKEADITPELSDLISAMRDLNRFME